MQYVVDISNSSQAKPSICCWPESTNQACSFPPLNILVLGLIPSRIYVLSSQKLLPGKK